VLPLMTLPWLPFFLASIWQRVTELFDRKAAQTPNTEINTGQLQLFAFAWIAVPFIFFSLSGSKLPGYILPAVPGTVILAGIYIFQFVKARPHRGQLMLIIAVSMLITIVISISFVVPKYADRESVKRLIESADEMGYSSSKVVNFQNISHNAEFYAAGRLVRESDGKQKRFDDPKELAAYVSNSDAPALVLTPTEKVGSLTSDKCFLTNSIAANGDLAILALVKPSVPCS
ncbi:MAG: ArnT family glycosyltransferase, partial [Pyrinomonadaceae bacterium]